MGVDVGYVQTYKDQADQADEQQIDEKDGDYPLLNKIVSNGEVQRRMKSRFTVGQNIFTNIHAVKQVFNLNDHPYAVENIDGSYLVAPSEQLKELCIGGGKKSILQYGVQTTIDQEGNTPEQEGDIATPEEEGSTTAGTPEQGGTVILEEEGEVTPDHEGNKLTEGNTTTPEEEASATAATLEQERNRVTATPEQGRTGAIPVQSVKFREQPVNTSVELQRLHRITIRRLVSLMRDSACIGKKPWKEEVRVNV